MKHIKNACQLSWGKLRVKPANRWFDWSFAPMPSSRDRFARQNLDGLPSGFPLTSTWPGIVHHLSGPNVYALGAPQSHRADPGPRRPKYEHRGLRGAPGLRPAYAVSARLSTSYAPWLFPTRMVNHRGVKHRPFRDTTLSRRRAPRIVTIHFHFAFGSRLVPNDSRTR